jgi:hypothetical protein
VSDEKCYRATEPKTLVEGLMSPNCPKSEREHYAVRVIEAADALAKLLRKYGSDHERLIPIGEALAAYEKVRGLK